MANHRFAYSSCRAGPRFRGEGLCDLPSFDVSAATPDAVPAPCQFVARKGCAIRRRDTGSMVRMPVFEITLIGVITRQPAQHRPAFKEPLHQYLHRHTGASQYPVKTISYWML